MNFIIKTYAMGTIGTHKQLKRRELQVYIPREPAGSVCALQCWLMSLGVEKERADDVVHVELRTEQGIVSAGNVPIDT